MNAYMGQIMCDVHIKIIQFWKATTLESEKNKLSVLKDLNSFFSKFNHIEKIKNMSLLVYNIPWSIEFYENIFSLLQGNFFKVFAHQNLVKK